MAILADLIEGNSGKYTANGWEGVTRIALVSGLAGGTVTNQLNAAMTAAGLPSIGDEHPSYENVTLRSIVPESLSGDVVRLRLEYAEQDELDSSTETQFSVGTTVSQSETSLDSAGDEITLRYKPTQQEVTADAASDTLSCGVQSYENGQRVMIGYGWGGAMPGGISADTLYYIVESSGHAFKLSATVGGEPLDITTAGTAPIYVEPWWTAYQGGTTPQFQPTTTLTASRVESVSPGQKSKTYVGKVNSGTWSLDPGCLAREWLCTGIDGSSNDRGSTWNVTYSFEYKPRIVDDDRLTGWDARVYYIDPDTGRPPSDCNSGDNKGEGYKVVQIYDEINFNALGL